MKLFNKVAIVGLGFIGGSIALACRKNKLAVKIIGISRRRSTLSHAKKTGIFDEVSGDLRRVAGCDLLIFAAPVETTMRLAGRVRDIIQSNCVVTDVGSTKKETVRELEKLFPGYVGSHPLAGSEKSGIRNAHPDLFKGTCWLLTPTSRTSRLAFLKVKVFAERIGARTQCIAPSLHDTILSFTSHLPHVAAFSLIASVPARYLPWSAGGLHDTTRIAASEEQLWTDIFLTNRKNILRAIRALQQNVARIKSAIDKGDRGALTKILKQARNKRLALEKTDIKKKYIS